MRKAFPLLLCLWVVLAVGCSYKHLSFFFDGVPNPEKKIQALPGTQAIAPTTRVQYSEHGPYAAKQCNACHNREMTNNLIVPVEQLCANCHELQLTKKYIHGPLLSGGCLVCHDPHSSPYRYLLKSESDTFCFYCHDQIALPKDDAHSSVTAQCTSCHDAHMSNNKYLLK